MSINEIVSDIKNHRLYQHPVFEHWATNQPAPVVLGALFHQIRCFCDSTRPGLNLPEGLQALGIMDGSHLLQEIVESEEDHGPQLATMAGHILNRAAGEVICADIDNQQEVEAVLKESSDRVLGCLPGYDAETGLMPQTREARAVFERRALTDKYSIYWNLGATLALETISNRHLIPGEKHCLVDSGLYNTSIEDPEMHYLKEHFGESGAEAMHEQHAIDALAAVLDDSNKEAVRAGTNAFLTSLTALWDLLDSALLQAGNSRKSRAEESTERATA